MRIRALILPLFLSLAPLSGAAQELPATPPVQSPVLTIDVDRLLADTQFGRRLADDLRERTEALAAENERLRLALTEEEQRLAERRPGMEMDEFRAQADAFDQRVQRIRADQDAKQRALEADVEENRQAFLNAVTPVLGRLMIDKGAAVIMERREVFLSASLIDITVDAIAAIDAQLGDGLTPPAAPEASQVTPDTPGEPEGATPAPAEDRAEPDSPDRLRTPLEPAPRGEDG